MSLADCGGWGERHVKQKMFFELPEAQETSPMSTRAEGARPRLRRRERTESRGKAFSQR